MVGAGRGTRSCWLGYILKVQPIGFAEQSVIEMAETHTLPCQGSSRTTARETESTMELLTEKTVRQARGCEWMTFVAERWVYIYLYGALLCYSFFLSCVFEVFHNNKFSIIKSLRRRRKKRMNGTRGRDRDDLQYGTIYKMPSRNRALISYPEVRKEFYSYE